MRRLEAALVDVVVCEGLCGVRAVLVYRDGHLRVGGASARHNAASWGHGQVSGGQQDQRAAQRASLNARRPKSTPEVQREDDERRREQSSSNPYILVTNEIENKNPIFCG